MSQYIYMYSENILSIISKIYNVNKIYLCYINDIWWF